MKIELNQLDKLISNKKVLFITNKNSFYRNGFDRVLNSSKFDVYNDFSLNPKLDEIKTACELHRSKSYDYILGVGGGSAMDFAKTLHYFIDLNLSEYSEYLSHVKNPDSAHISSQLILIPTTSGSGSEATHFSVVYNGKSKLSFADTSLYPNYVVLDPLFTKDLPSKITAYTGMDAIVHSIESFWAMDATSESKSFALKALNLLVPNIKEAVFSPNTLNRKAMLKGSYLAGKAIDISKTTAAHAFSYYLTTHFNIPHGQAVANTLPYFLNNNGHFGELEQIFKTQDLRQTFVQLLNDLKLNIEVMDLVDDLDHFIDSVNLQRLKNNPTKFTKAELKELFTNK